MEKICKDFKTKNLVEYHDLYVQSDTLLLLNFRNMCLEIYDKFIYLLAPGLAWQAALNKG